LVKIDMISEHASPLTSPGGADAGGQNVYVGALATALVNRGHEVTVLTRRDDADLPDRMVLASGVTVEHVTAGPCRYIAKDGLFRYMGEFAVELSRRWRVLPPDIVHAHFWMSGLAALDGACGRAFPIVQTFHALGSVKRRYQGATDTSPANRIRVERRIVHRVDAIIATCTDEVAELGLYGASPSQVFVVPCGVDTDVFRPDGPRAERDSTRFRIITFGRLVPRKGVDTIVRALREVPEAELLVVGGPAVTELGGDEEVRRLMDLARAEGVADRVIFAGRVDHDELAPLIRSADVAVSVPWYEPFGIAPVEAMACGVPVIASAVGGHLDTVVDGVTGVHVPARRSESVVRALRLLIEDGSLRFALGAAAAERARDHYGWTRIAAETEGVYDRILASRPEPVSAADTS
jgi:D-inositol-3-phosphate glycosyltransferase